jgi:8-oxo-dGTP pyrophosphatase MutT (NUDIX family)
MDDKSTIYCNNCGLKGHIQRDCRNPVLSCGNLLFRTDKDEDQVLMIQRKDSLCFIEFIRGKYDVYNIDYIQILIDKFTIDEKRSIINNSFDELWSTLWMIDIETIQKNSDYHKGHDKFMRLSNGFHFKKRDIFINLQYFVDNSKTNYMMTEWEFPKGRRNYRESDLECAKREFSEETNYNCDDYKLIMNLEPFTEEFVGENRVRYKYLYYIGYLTNLEKEVFIDITNKDQVTELKDIKWVTKRESLEMIRDYHHTRFKIINDIFDFIDSLSEKYILV